MVIRQLFIQFMGMVVMAQNANGHSFRVMHSTLKKIESQYTAQERSAIRKGDMPLDNERINIGNYASKLIDNPELEPISNEFRRRGITDQTVMIDIMMKALWMHLVEGKKVDFGPLVSWGIEKQKYNRGEKSAIPPMRTAKTPEEAIKMLTEKKKPKRDDEK